MKTYPTRSVHAGRPHVVDRRIALVLLTVAALGVGAAILCGLGWYRAATAVPDPWDLPGEVRQSLIEDLLDKSPGLYRWAYFDPRIGYTLRPSSPIEAWNSVFRSNRMGFRSPPMEKGPDVFRIVFVGDSWTFGMGVDMEQAYPAVVAELANRYAGVERRVQAWTVALPGYNTFNQLAAFWFLFDDLRPDAVVIAPSANDHHSTRSILPNGSTWSGETRPDQFGDPHCVTYSVRQVDSYRARDRWRQCFEALRDTELRLKELDIPVLFAFVARWDETTADYHVAKGEIEAPYVIVPLSLTLGRWRNPPPVEHGTPEAHRRYARIVYRGLESLLPWHGLPPGPHDDEGRPRLSSEVDRSTLWADYERQIQKATKRDIPASYRPSKQSSRQVAGPFGRESGLMGFATTLLIRRPANVKQLRVQVRRVEKTEGLYPLTLTVSIPSGSGGTRRQVAIEDAGKPRHEFLVPLPQDIETGKVIDVVIESDRATKSAQSSSPSSVFIEAIDPIP